MKNTKNLISRKGFEALEREWKDLKYNQRPEMQRQVATAAAEGDRSENAAYTFGKLKLREIDRRLRALDKLIDHAEIVEDSKNHDEVHFGSSVTLIDQNGKKSTWHLVGSAEINPLENRISLESPLGKALLGKKENDYFEFKTPRAQVAYKIEKIE